jgi:ABC-2 type transport system ATP-binding protein
MSILLETQGLAKHYGKLTALRPVDLQVRAGEVFGLLGPNGAGKTTLLRLVMGFLRPSAGSASVAGYDSWRERVRVHEQTAYLAGEVRLVRSMSGKEFLETFAKFRPGTDPGRAMALARRLDVDISRRIAACSSGMRQKLAIAMTLAPDVPLVILDEPTNHLDPTARLEVLNLVREARTEGRAVLFSSHVFEEADGVCDSVGLLQRGSLVNVMPLSDVRGTHRVTARPTGPLVPPASEWQNRITIQQQTADRVVWLVQGELAEALPWLAAQPLADLRVEPLGLQSVYEHFYLRDEP